MSADDATGRRFTTPPGTAEIEALAERALRGIPPKLRRHIANVGIAVEDFADDATLDEMGIESAWDLTGLYRGTPLHRRSFDEIARAPDRIFLYRQPILLEWVETGEDFFRLV